MTQLQWPGVVIWLYKTNRGQQTDQVICPEGKELKIFGEIRTTTLAVTSSHSCK